MFYLSEVIGKRVIDLNGHVVARIRDLVAEVLIEAVEGTEAALAGDASVAMPDQTNPSVDEATEPLERDVPVIKGLIVYTGSRRSQEALFIPVENVGSLGHGGARLSTRSDLMPFERREGALLLARDLWDKQVVDLEQRRVVRVNDIVLAGPASLPRGDGIPVSTAGRSKPTGEMERAQAAGALWWVRGVDVGLGGLANRLRVSGLLKAVARKPLHPHIVRWQHLDMFGSYVPGGVALQHKKLAQLHPVEIARITDSVSYHQGAEIIASLNDTLAADTLEELVSERQTDIVEYMPEERAADIIEEMSPDEATDLLSELSSEKADALLGQMDEEEAQEVRHLMRYPEHSAGGRMTTDFVRVLPNMTVGEVIEVNKPVFLSADLIYYMYVVDSMADQKLQGIITVRDLLVHERDERVEDFMLKDVVSVRPGENEREMARKMAEYNLLALPVVDRNGTLEGVVTVDDALEALLPEGWQKRMPKIFS